MDPIQSGPPSWAWFQPKINYQLIKFQPKNKIFNPKFTVTSPAQIDMKVCMTYSFSITVRTSKFQDFTQSTRNNKSSITSRIWTSISKVWLNLDQKVTIQQNMKLQQQSLFFLQKMKLTQKLPDHLMLRFLHFGEAEGQLSSPTQLASSNSPLGLWSVLVLFPGLALTDHPFLHAGCWAQNLFFSPPGWSSRIQDDTSMICIR